MKLKYLILITLVFIGCSNKTITTTQLNKPNIFQITKVSKITAKEDKLNLKPKIIQILQQNLIPINSPNGEKIEILYSNYEIKISKITKNHKIQYSKKNPRCIYLARECAFIEGKILCKTKISFKFNKYSPIYKTYLNNKYKDLSSNLYFFKFQNKLYLIKEKCKPIYSKEYCLKIKANANAKIKVNEIQKEYFSNVNDEICQKSPSIKINKIKYKDSLVNDIINQFKKDFLPYTQTYTINLEIYKKFQDKLPEETIEKVIKNFKNKNLSQNQKILSNLLKKYQNNPYLLYLMAINLELEGKINKAKQIYLYLYKRYPNEEILKALKRISKRLKAF